MFRTLELTYPRGIHARPSVELAELAKKFSSEIIIIKNERKVSAKDVFDILSMGIVPGQFGVEAVGQDESAAIQEIENFINKLNKSE